MTRNWLSGWAVATLIKALAMEQVYNIFIYFENDICSEIGYIIHEHDGSDDDGIVFLRGRVELDFPAASKQRLTRSFTRAEYNAKCRTNESHFLFDEVLESLGASSSCLMVVTPIRNGEIFYNYSSESGPLNMDDVWAQVEGGRIMADWLVKYTSEKGIDLSQLIHDDYFLAIKLTYNARLYVSAMKLLVSCIDSIAYIEFGNVRNPVPFINWLDTYADLSALGITASELWELRNGILHMSNINSNRVREGKVRRVTFKVGGAPDHQPTTGSDVYYFDFYLLIQIYGRALGVWVQTYNETVEKFSKFVERYDETISDSRFAYAKVDDNKATEL